MNNKFDELTKSMAQSVTRRQALKKFSVGLAGMALACFGLANRAKAGARQCKGLGDRCQRQEDCCDGLLCLAPQFPPCLDCSPKRLFCQKLY